LWSKNTNTMVVVNNCVVSVGICGAVVFSAIRRGRGVLPFRPVLAPASCEKVNRVRSCVPCGVPRSHRTNRLPPLPRNFFTGKKPTKPSVWRVLCPMASRDDVLTVQMRLTSRTESQNATVRDPERQDTPTYKVINAVLGHNFKPMGACHLEFRMVPARYFI